MVETYRVVIKGNTTQAIYAAQSRGFAIVGIIKNGAPDGSGVTILKIERNQNSTSAADIVLWLSEGPKPPFPPGTLLFYGVEQTGESKTKVWIAKHGWSMEDDLEGLESEPHQIPVAQYDLGDVIVSVWDGGRHYLYRVEIHKGLDSNGRPKLIFSSSYGTSSPEDAARSAILGAMNTGDLKSIYWDRFRDVKREQRAGLKPKRPGWKVDDDLEGARLHYEVFVGNVGVVYNGPDAKEAHRKFAEYVQQSKQKSGRASGERVVIFENNEIVNEFDPKGGGWPMDDDLDGLQAFHPWSVSTLVPGLRGKPVYKYFDDFGSALAYARDRARKGKRLREGGRAYFILSHTANPDGVAAYRVFRAFLRAQQRPGYQHIINKPEYVIVQEAKGTVPGDPSKTLWKVNMAHSVEIQ